jgi:3-phosphoglycerate kinase
MAKVVISDLPDSELEGKRAFIRIDLNVPTRK